MTNIYNMVNLKNNRRDNNERDNNGRDNEGIDNNNEGIDNNGRGNDNEGRDNEGRDNDNDYYINMNNSDNNCMICLEEIVNFDSNSKLPCGCINYFHGKCLKEWFNLNNYCPICRKDIVRRIEYTYQENRSPSNICAGTIIMGLFTTYFLFLLQVI